MKKSERKLEILSVLGLLLASLFVGNQLSRYENGF